MSSPEIHHRAQVAGSRATGITEGTAFSVGRCFLGIAVAASGVLQLVTDEFVRLVPNAAAGGDPSPLPYLVGAVLFAAGCAIAAGRLARLAGCVLAGLIVVSLVVKQLPRLAENPGAFFMWTNPLKGLAIAGGAVLLAAALTPTEGGSRPAPALQRLEVAAILVLAIFLVVCGLQHFVYVDFVTMLVPSWIPGQRFWAYLTGAALIAGGVGILVPRTSRTAATLTSVMIFLWVLLLHIPRAAAGPNHANEAAGVFEALAISGIALMVRGRSAWRGRRAG
jgi:uncharacterized membrane protein YphA (DoxX/SURF4 family)